MENLRGMYFQHLTTARLCMKSPACLGTPPAQRAGIDIEGFFLSKLSDFLRSKNNLW